MNWNIIKLVKGLLDRYKLVTRILVERYAHNSLIELVTKLINTDLLRLVKYIKIANRKMSLSDNTSSQLLGKGTVSKDKKQIVMNLYESGIAEEFIAMRASDLQIQQLLRILKEYGIYKGDSEEK